MTLPKSLRTVLCAAGLGILPIGCAFAAEGQPGASTPSEFIFLVQIAVLIFVGRLLGEAIQRIGQPAVMGQLLGGLLLGPSVFGALWPEAQHVIFPNDPAQKSMIDAVSQLGILLLLLLTGMETDLKLVRKVGRAAISISVAGICLPFVCGFALGEFMPAGMLPNPDQRLIASLFLGTALSISSLKIVATVVREMNFMRRNVGQVILASAVIDDTIGWIIIAITFSLASHGTIDAMSLVRSILGTAAFLAFSLTVGRRLVFSLIRWANDNLVSEVPVISVILLVMVAMALTTHLIGVHTVLGAFVAGILVGESPILTRQIDQQLRGLIMGLFMPVFFGLAGLSADLTILKNPNLLLFTAGLIAIASVGKFFGAFVGGKLGRLTGMESLALACGMNARGSTEVIVATIGLSMGVLNNDMFTMIVAMAVITTMAMPPMLRWALARLPLGKEEKERLDREEFEAKGFVPNLERILLAVDESDNGKFASRLAGLIAGARGMPTTVLHVGRETKRKETAHAESPESHLKAGAETTAATEEKIEEAKPAKVDITTKAKGTRTDDAVAAEARKGYDLLVVGVDNTISSKGGFSKEITQVASGFEGPLAIVVARGKHLEHPEDNAFKILVPVTGTDVSRRAAEVAVALARSIDVSITALYVSETTGSDGKRRVNLGSATRRYEEAVLKDFVDLSERYDTPAQTSVSVNVAPDDAIVWRARDGRFDLIVMGVNRHLGDTLFFGNVAAAVLEKSKASVLLVSGGANPGTNTNVNATGG